MSTHLHPDWCGHGHVCSIDGPGAEHRSHPVTIDTHHARLVLTRTQNRHGHNRIEVRVVVDLPTDPDQARQAAQRVTTAIGHAVAAQLPSGPR